MSLAYERRPQRAADAVADETPAPLPQGLLALAAHSFGSTEELTQAILRLAAEQAGMRTSYLAQVTPAEALLEILAAYNAPGGCGVRAGEQLPLPTTYCQEVAGAAAPVLIPDTREAPTAARRAAAAAHPGIGSYIGVPIRLSDERLFGTLCAVDAEPRALSLQQADLLAVLARFLATQIERDAELRERKRAEARLAEALAEQRRINAQLERLSAAKSHFVSIVSHEFRTALTGIQGFSEMMRDEDFSIAEMKEFAGDINDDAKRLNRMISELLDLDRMESGRMNLDVRPLDLNALLSGAAEQLRRTSPRHPLRLELDPALPLVAGDRDKLLQVLSNLLSNAVKYSPEGGPITVASAREEDGARVSVRDSGIGIAPEELERIFERYRRSEAGAARYIPGTGLGLPITRQIVELHGGSVWAESAPGRGSTFTFTVPWAGPERG